MTNIIANAREQFLGLQTRGSRIGFWDNKKFPNKRYHPKNPRKNHFQGIQRFGDKLIISGAFVGEEAAEIYSLSKSGNQEIWGSNLQNGQPDITDQVTDYKLLNNDSDLKKLWHAGGIASEDSVLAVALMGGGKSAVTFYDLDNNFDPLCRENRDHFKAGACALTKLTNGHYLLAVWSDSDDKSPANPNEEYHIDYYLSREKNISAGFHQPAVNMIRNGPFRKKLQSIDFVWEDDNGTHKLHIAGFYSATLLPAAKRHFGLLAPVDLPDSWVQDTPNPAPGTSPKIIESLAVKKKFFCGNIFSFRNKWCHMSAGTCLHVTTKGRLVVYSVSHYIKPDNHHPAKHDSFVRCTEFITEH